MTTLAEADVEQAVLEWLSGVGWQVLHGPDIAPDVPSAMTTVRWCSRPEAQRPVIF